MAAAKNTNRVEKRCRKKIATLLSLMGFHDDDPETTIIIMRQKLKEIQEKEAIANAASNNKKLSTNIKKITFKCGGKTTSSVIHLETLVQETNFPVVAVPKKKRSSIQRLPNSKFHTKTTSVAAVAHPHDSKMITNYDDSAHQRFQDKLFNKIEKDHDNVCSSSSVIINDDDDYDDDGGVMMMIKKMEIDHVSRNPSSGHTMIIDDEDDDDDADAGSNVGVMDLNDFVSSIGGSDPELVIEKQLTSSDVAKNHGRLLIPALKVMNHATFLTREEKWVLANRKNISVCVFDPQRREYTLNLGQWNMSENKNYVLKTQWNQLVSVNRFKEGMTLQVKSFRVDHELCFALVRVQ